MSENADFAKQLLPHLRAIVELCEKAIDGEATALRSHAMKGAGDGGRIKDLRKNILDLLIQRPNLTSAELATALYSDDMGISADLFKRRVIVHVSNMHKRGVLWSYQQPGSRELRWHLNPNPIVETMNDRFNPMVVEALLEKPGATLVQLWEITRKSKASERIGGPLLKLGINAAIGSMIQLGEVKEERSANGNTYTLTTGDNE